MAERMMFFHATTVKKPVTSVFRLLAFLFPSHLSDDPEYIIDLFAQKKILMKFHADFCYWLGYRVCCCMATVAGCRVRLESLLTGEK
jgi:hypothetical protein